MPNSTSLAIIAIALIGLAAAIMKINDGILIAAVSGIAGLGGYELGKSK